MRVFFAELFASFCYFYYLCPQIVKPNTDKIMKRKLLTTLLMLFVAIATQAEDTTQRLVVWQKSGEKVYIDLTEEPETTFENGQLVIKTTKTTVYCHLENVLRYTYEGAMTAINTPKHRPGDGLRWPG